MVRYPKELAQALRYSGVLQTAWETQIQVKPIPDEARPGRLDPRNLADALKREEQALGKGQKRADARAAARRNGLSRMEPQYSGHLDQV